MRLRRGFQNLVDSRMWYPSSTDRERLGACAARCAPAPGLSDRDGSQVPRLKEADREWLIWRFGEDT